MIGNNVERTEKLKQSKLSFVKSTEDSDDHMTQESSLVVEANTRQKDINKNSPKRGDRHLTSCQRIKPN